jgi:hypothetical protein
VIFTRAHVDQILAGEKTMTRRLVKTGELGEVIKTYQLGHTYKLHSTREWTASSLTAHQRRCAGQHPTRARAVLASIDKPLDAEHPRGQSVPIMDGSEAVVVTVTAVRRERLGDISTADLRREGFKSLLVFKAVWMKLHRCWNPDLEVWVIQFHLGPPADQLRLLPSVVDAPSVGEPENGNYTASFFRAMTGSMDPGEALRDEEYIGLGVEAEERHRLVNTAELQRRDARSLAIRLKDAQKRGDADAIAKIRHELLDLEHEIRSQQAAA